MRAEESPFPLGWMGTALQHVGLDAQRPRVGTYRLYDYASLPPLPVPLVGDFGWLAAEPLQPEWPIGGVGEDWALVAANSARLLAAEEAALPRAFVTYLKTPTLHGRIRSTTACSLDICPIAVSAPVGGGRLVRFLADQQGCCFWYVYLAPGGDDHAVVMSGGFFGAPEEDWDDARDEEIVFVAESFEAFLCRLWLENEIAFAFDYNGERRGVMPPAAERYIELYRGAPAR